MWWIVAAALAALAGCEPLACTIPYSPLVVPSHASRFALFESAELEARSIGAAERAPARLSVDATRAQGDLRDRVSIAVDDEGRLSVAVRTDLSDGHGGWITAPGMCS